jgi:hypothetical protein
MDDAGKSSPAGHLNGALGGRDDGRTAKNDSIELGNAVTVTVVVVDDDDDEDDDDDSDATTIDSCWDNLCDTDVRVVTLSETVGAASIDDGGFVIGGNGGGISSPSPLPFESSDAADADENAFGRPFW